MISLFSNRWAWGFPTWPWRSTFTARLAAPDSGASFPNRKMFLPNCKPHTRLQLRQEDDMQPSEYKFVDRTGEAAKPGDLISPVVIPKEAIAAEVERLASLPRPANGRRVSYVVNPATGVGHGLAPGIAVSISVLLPGERRKPIRHNSS